MLGGGNRTRHAARFHVVAVKRNQLVLAVAFDPGAVLGKRRLVCDALECLAEIAGARSVLRSRTRFQAGTGSRAGSLSPALPSAPVGTASVRSRRSAGSSRGVQRGGLAGE
jgi:hypothetical protein